MKRIALRRSIIVISLLALAGAALSEAYYLRRMNERLDQISSRHLVVHPWFGQVAYLDPLDAFQRVDEQLARDLGSMDRLWITAGAIRGEGPDVQLTQSADAYRVKVDLPGIKPENLKVRLDGRVLSINARTSDTEQTRVGQQDERQQYTNQYSESFTLPGPVGGTHVQQVFRDGALVLTVPRPST